MNANHPDWKLISAMAEIPVLDWRGTEFLIFYGMVFVLAFAWSARRLLSLRRRLERPGEEAGELKDPYDAAYLAAGPLRCAQLAVVRLLEKGVVEWKPGRLLAEGRLMARSVTTGTEDLNEIEQSLLRGIRAGSGNGLRMSSLVTLTRPLLPRIEAKLARLGLRPTEEERRQLGWRAVLPMLILAGLGLMKIGIGLARGKPVGFLLAAVALTVVIAMILKAKSRFLTATGEQALEGMRRERTRPAARNERGEPVPATQDLSMGLALLGPVAVAGYASLLPDRAGFRKELRQMGSPGGSCSSAGGSGCGGGAGSSGCGGGGGGSGCGGGGCGGCGGGD